MFLILFFFFNDSAPTEFYTLSLHDALPICMALARGLIDGIGDLRSVMRARGIHQRRRRSVAIGTSRTLSPKRADRKSTRLNSSHMSISYAVFCLKKKKTTTTEPQ